MKAILTYTSGKKEELDIIDYQINDKYVQFQSTDKKNIIKFIHALETITVTEDDE